MLLGLIITVHHRPSGSRNSVPSSFQALVIEPSPYVFEEDGHSDANADSLKNFLSPSRSP